jgi:hypothetical protein
MPIRFLTWGRARPVIIAKMKEGKLAIRDKSSLILGDNKASPGVGAMQVRVPS